MKAAPVLQFRIGDATRHPNHTLPRWRCKPLVPPPQSRNLPPPILPPPAPTNAPEANLAFFHCRFPGCRKAPWAYIIMYGAARDILSAFRRLGSGQPGARHPLSHRFTHPRSARVTEDVLGSGMRPAPGTASPKSSIPPARAPACRSEIRVGRARVYLLTSATAGPGCGVSGVRCCVLIVFTPGSAASLLSKQALAETGLIC